MELVDARNIWTHHNWLLASPTIDLISQAGELYDLQADPHELRNLWNDPNYADRKELLLGYIHSRPDDAQGIKEQVGMA